MKTNKLYIILVLVFLTDTSWAQVPTDSVRALWRWFLDFSQ